MEEQRKECEKGSVFVAKLSESDKIPYPVHRVSKQQLRLPLLVLHSSTTKVESIINSNLLPTLFKNLVVFESLVHTTIFARNHLARKLQFLHDIRGQGVEGINGAIGYSLLG